MAMMEFDQVKDAALKFDKPTLARMAQMGQMSPTIAVMAGMMRDRIVQSEIKPPAPPTVAEEVMQPMGQRMGIGAPQPQQAAGISQIPVREDMFEEPQGMASGGIVAFQGGGRGIDYSQFGEYGEELERQEALRKLYIGENEALKAEREGMDAATSEQRAMRLIEAGLGIMGGDSPYALQNIGRGAQSALKGYGEDVAAQRKRKAELASMDRAERLKTLESAMGATQAREKATPEDIRTARAIQQEAREAGRKVPTLTQALKSIEKTSGTATLQAAYVSSQRDAAKAVGELINSSAFNSRLKSIEKKQGKEAAEEYKRQKIRETVGLFPGVDPASVMAFIGGGGATSGTSSGTVDKNNPLLR